MRPHGYVPADKCPPGRHICMHGPCMRGRVRTRIWRRGRSMRYMRGTWPGCHFPLRPHLGQNAGYPGETSSKSWSLRFHALGLHNHAWRQARPVEHVQCTSLVVYSMHCVDELDHLFLHTHACSWSHVHVLSTADEWIGFSVATC
jgi:hypothetical protein